VTVTETLSDVEGIVTFGPPKTRASRRTLALPSFLVAELEAHLVAFPPGEAGLLFTGPRGGPLRFSVFRQRVWNPAIAAAGIKRATPHTLRHSQAALLIESGEHPLVVARRLGHTSVKFVLDTYGHLFAGLDQGAADRLDASANAAPARSRRGPEVVELPTRRRKTQP
jgi:integrase